MKSVFQRCSQGPTIRNISNLRETIYPVRPRDDVLFFFILSFLDEKGVFSRYQ